MSRRVMGLSKRNVHEIIAPIVPDELSAYGCGEWLAKWNSEGSAGQQVENLKNMTGINVSEVTHEPEGIVIKFEVLWF